jgi:predicted cupin superfamily sugar epimerase
LNKSAEFWIKKLNLQEHPEGGYYIEMHRSEILVNVSRSGSIRNACTAIYYLLKGNQFSSFHMLLSDETWHFYDGSSLTLHIIRADGKLSKVKLGMNFDDNEAYQAVVSSGSWFAASVNEASSYSLVGCIVSPGFDYGDWNMTNVESLSRIYPQHRGIIQKYTRHT